MMVRVVSAGDGRLRRLVTCGWLPRLGLGCTAAVMAMLVYGGAGAWAAAPEIPETKPASEITGATATLHGVLNPQNTGDPGTYEFLYKASATECEGEGGQTTPTGTALGHKQEAVSASVTQLLPFTQYAFCLLARNEAGETALGSPVTFTTPAVAPIVAEQSVANVGSTTATLSASIDPGGEPTSYRVEYGATTAYGATTPQASLPASSTPVSVRAELSGLQPGIEYHFRFLAQNTVGTALPGADMAFTAARSLGASELTLPDNRAYEMVSPPDGRDVYLPETTNLVQDLGAPNFVSAFPFRAAADGNAVAYNGAAPSSGGNGLQLANGNGNQFMARRGPHGWTAVDILPSPQNANELIQHEEYQAFSSDLSVGMVFSAEGDNRALPLAAGASVCDGLYARTTSDGAFHALFTETPIPTPTFCARETFAGASADGSHVLFETNVALTPEAEPAEGEGRENLYESVGGRLASVNVLDGKPVPNATFGSEFKSIFNPSVFAPQFTDFSNVVAADGSKVFWTDLNSNHVYVREDRTTTVPVSAGEAQFWMATPDGRYVFYTEGEQLWRFDVDSKTREALTPGGAEAEVRGVVGASTDGSYVYFVAGGALAEGTARRSCKPIFVQEAEVEAAFNESRITKTEERERLNTLNVENREDHKGEIPPTTGCTLYVRHAGHTTQVATLSPDDDSLPQPVTEGQFGDWLPNLGGRTAQVTPDGHGVVFESRQRLTGYDNLVNGSAANEAFVYNADSARLSCVSCNPTGAPPSAAGPRAGQEAGQEALLPRNQLNREPARSTYTLRWISEDGTRVFFNTAQSLVPQDTNGQADVYEWEREGAPSCPKGVFPRSNGGCVFLLSGGQGNSSHGAVFVDASANGDDVFFETRAKLVPGDRDENMKLYDARVGGGFPEPSLACTGTGCQGVPPGPPPFATPSSATFTGTGNFPPASSAKHVSLTKAQRLAKALKACRGTRAKKKRIVGCEKHARRLYAPAHKARKTTRARGGRRHQ
jgi:Fibronectin type III domain